MNNVIDFFKKNTMIIALVIVTLLFTVLTQGKILLPQNLSNVISQNAYVVILAVGMLLCILTGGNIDLSVGSVVALVGAIAGTLIVNKQVNLFVSIIICLGVGILIGAWQGFWIAYVRIPPFIVTLAGMLIWRGAALIILNGLTISPFPDNYLSFFNSFVPNPFGGSIHILTIIVGAVISLVFACYTLWARGKRIKKGYETKSIGGTIGKR